MTTQERHEQVLQIVRATPREHAQTPADCYLMGCRLSEFTAEEQAEILLWALEQEQKKSNELRRMLEMLTELRRRRPGAM